MATGRVIEHKFWRSPEGRSFSVYSSYVPDGSELVDAGFTILWPDGTSGTGRAPYKTRAEAEAAVARMPNFPGMSQR